MENLAQIHLELANQNVKEVPEVEIKTSNVGASWDKQSWNEIFEASADELEPHSADRPTNAE